MLLILQYSASIGTVLCVQRCDTSKKLARMCVILVTQQT